MMEHRMDDDTNTSGGIRLEACPFCGGEKARVIHIRDGRKVACPCGACGKPEFHGPNDWPTAHDRAITSWNTRTGGAV
ncbi:hypothetical protein BV87_16370 [Sphingobium yanoikuyae]|uniref:Restriction alleviation protein, Lar family n=2 Tax=Sphingobium yanoikuyae TaxID=13690 RepID=A0A2D1R4L9_SPHYA|nr:hypothetical protein BV87_16370 [Sphingobium yanoikuyae]